VIRIDARGMRCPWPALRLARALRDGADLIEVCADDPQAPAELTRTAEAAGATIATTIDRCDGTFVVTAKRVGNTVFTQSG
jgi:tRNA 2-thiouridine synthesizing protein A